jgi:uncharacterized coiled-coil protein SlyX
MKNQDLQARILEQEKHLAEQSAFITELNSKVNINLTKRKHCHYYFFRLI